MKAITISTFLVFLSFCVIAQQNDLLPKAVYSKNSVCSIDSTHTNTYDTITVSNGLEKLYSTVTFHKQLSIPKIIVDAAIAGTIPVYDSYSLGTPKEYDFMYFLNNFTHPTKPSTSLSKIDMFDKLGGNIDSLWVQDKETENYTAKAIITEYNLDQIKELLTIETWAYDSAKFTFTKHIEWYNFIRHYTRYDENELRKRMTFWIENNQAKKQSKLITIATIEYEFVLFPEGFYVDIPLGEEIYVYNNTNPGINTYFRYILYSSIINKVLTNKIQAYDFTTNTKLTHAEFKERCGYEESIVYYEHPETHTIESHTIVKQGTPDDLFKSIIFTEELYFDPKTYSFYKKVIAISPVSWNFNWDTNRVKKEVAFKVYLN